MTMTDLQSNGEYDHAIAEFMRELDASPDRPAVVHRFAARYPELGRGFFEECASARQVVEGAFATPPSEDGHQLQPGEKLGEFTIVRFLAGGGMGEVYLAEQEYLSKRKVALKVVRAGYTNPTAIPRFLREQEVLAKLHQSNVVPVFSAGRRGALQYFAMQYIDGASLRNVVGFLQTHGSSGSKSGKGHGLAELVESVAEPDEPAEAIPTATQVGAPPVPIIARRPRTIAVLTDEYCRSVAAGLADAAEALHAIHKAGYLHRDIKSSNLMAERSGKCWVIDLGLAKRIGEVGPNSKPGDDATDVILTSTGGAVGTYAYMAPEQFRGQPEPRSDVWSLGVTMYELLGLRLPFDAKSVLDLEEMVRFKEPPRLRDLAKNVPPDLEAICQAAMRKDPATRYKTAQDFADDLRRWLRNEPTAANPPWVGRRVRLWVKRNPGWATAIAVGLVALTSIGIMQIRTEQRRVQAAEAELSSKVAIEEERTKSAEAKTLLANEKLEVEQLRVRQGQISAVEREYAGLRSGGWRNRLWDQMVVAMGSKREPQSRDRLTALLAGLDLEYIKDFREGAANSVAFSPDGTRLAMGGSRAGDPDHNQPTRVRDLKTGVRRRLTVPGISNVAWRGDVPVQIGQTRGDAWSYSVWDIDADRPLEQFRLPLIPVPQILRAVGRIGLKSFTLSADGLTAVAYMHGPFGLRLAVGWRSGAELPAFLIPLPTSSDPLASDKLATSADGRLLAIGSENGRISVYSIVDRPVVVAEFTLDTDHVSTLTFGRTREVVAKPTPGAGWLIAAGSRSGTLSVWGVDDKKLRFTNHVSENEILGLCFSRDGTTLASSGRDYGWMWDVESGRPLLQGSTRRGFAAAVDLSPDGRHMATASLAIFGSHGHVDLHRLEPGRGIQSLRGLAGQVKRAAVTPDGRRVAALTQFWQAGVWDTATGELIARVEVPRALYADHTDLRLTNDGRSLVVVGGREARRWELPADAKGFAKLVDTWPLKPALSNRLGISADGRAWIIRTETRSGSAYAVAGVPPTTDPRRVRQYELVAGQEAKLLAEHADFAWHVYDMFGTPDGSVMLAVGLRDGRKETHRAIAFDGHTGEQLWETDLSKLNADGGARISTDGSTIEYYPGSEVRMLRSLPFAKGQKDRVSGPHEGVLLGTKYALLFTAESHFELCVPGAKEGFVRLSPDVVPSMERPEITPDGRLIVWGNADGSVQVADLPAIRERLTKAGFPGW